MASSAAHGQQPTVSSQPTIKVEEHLSEREDGPSKTRDADQNPLGSGGCVARKSGHLGHTCSSRCKKGCKSAGQGKCGEKVGQKQRSVSPPAIWSAASSSTTLGVVHNQDQTRRRKSICTVEAQAHLERGSGGPFGLARGHPRPRSPEQSRHYQGQPQQHQLWGPWTKTGSTPSSESEKTSPMHGRPNANDNKPCGATSGATSLLDRLHSAASLMHLRRRSSPALSSSEVCNSSSTTTTTSSNQWDLQPYSTTGGGSLAIAGALSSSRTGGDNLIYQRERPQPDPDQWRRLSSPPSLEIGLNTSSWTDARKGTVRTGHQDIRTLYAASNVTYPDTKISINLMNAPDNSTVQCDCGHINCPLCNLMMNLELTDPSLLQ